jgi:hypothetical protein
MAPTKGPSILHLLHVVVMVMVMMLHFLGVHGRNRQSKRDSSQCSQDESNFLHLSYSPGKGVSKVVLDLTKMVSNTQGQHYEWTFRLAGSSLILISILGRALWTRDRELGYLTVVQGCDAR